MREGLGQLQRLAGVRVGLLGPSSEVVGESQDLVEHLLRVLGDRHHDPARLTVRQLVDLSADICVYSPGAAPEAGNAPATRALDPRGGRSGATRRSHGVPWLRRRAGNPGARRRAPADCARHALSGTRPHGGRGLARESLGGPGRRRTRGTAASAPVPRHRSWCAGARAGPRRRARASSTSTTGHVVSAPPGLGAFGARVARRWVRVYTRGLDPEVREARRAEIDSDIFEQLTASHPNPRRTGAAIAGRTLRGVPGDLAWRGEERAMDRTAVSALASGPTRHLRWLALIPLGVSTPFIVFGLAWGTVGQVSVGIALVLISMVIWRVVSGAWPLDGIRRPTRSRELRGPRSGSW